MSRSPKTCLAWLEVKGVWYKTPSGTSRQSCGYCDGPVLTEFNRQLIYKPPFSAYDISYHNTHCAYSLKSNSSNIIDLCVLVRCESVMLSAYIKRPKSFNLIVFTLLVILPLRCYHYVTFSFSCTHQNYLVCGSARGLSELNN